jgi:putative Mg2+ transporter-C (MgtC) family protein
VPLRDIALNLLLAAGLSGLIGLEREWHVRTAGLRTHMMVGLGSALFTMAGLDLGSDPSRVAAQIVTGIGFLGAGAIFRSGETIKGLTTAAGLWTVAGIGMAAGAGLVAMAVTATVIGLFILYALLPVVDRIRGEDHGAPSKNQGTEDQGNKDQGK